MAAGAEVRGGGGGSERAHAFCFGEGMVHMVTDRRTDGRRVISVARLFHAADVGSHQK